MTQSQQLRKLAAQSATAFLVAALCAFPLYIDKFSNLGVVKFTAVCTLCWAFVLWLGALRAVGAAPQPGRLPWRQDTALWALGAVTVSGVVSTALSFSPAASFWGLGGYYGGSREDGPKCGMDWLRLLKGRFGHTVWLNPSERPGWGQYWCQTYDAISQEFPMFPLTVDGLEEAMKKLLVR